MVATERGLGRAESDTTLPELVLQLADGDIVLALPDGKVRCLGLKYQIAVKALMD
jgi:hypothetical protein